MVIHPKISQRSIVAFTSLNGGTPSPGEWLPCQYMAPLVISSPTPFTIAVDDWQASGAGAAKIRPKWQAGGDTVEIEFLFDSTASPSEEYGVEATASFVLTVENEDDPARGIEGATVERTINVLVLGSDFPYLNEHNAFLALRCGEAVDHAIQFERRAGKWNSVAVNTGFSPDDPGVVHLLSDQSPIVSFVKVGGLYAYSGLYLTHEDPGELAPPGSPGVFRIRGTAARPGVYRVAVDMKSTARGFGEDEQIYHEFPGGDGDYAIILWIYESYQPGDLVVLQNGGAAPAPRKALEVVKSPWFGADGYGEHLPAVEWEYDDEDGTWSGTFGEPPTIFSYEIYLDEEDLTWYLLGSSTGAADPSMHILASAPARGFDNEEPPKQGWSNEIDPADETPLVLGGTREYFLARRPGDDVDNSGWYDFAGQIELTPPAPDGEEPPPPVAVDVFEREIHYVPSHESVSSGGWATLYGEPLRGDGARYILRLAGTWHIADDVLALADYATVASLPEIAAPALAHARVALPFCPAKLGDLGVHIPVLASGGVATSGGGVLHSLSRPYSPAVGNHLARLSGNVAGHQWCVYPLRRLVDMSALGATVTITIDDYRENSLLTGQRGDFISSGGTATADWMVENEATANIVTSTPKNYFTSSRSVVSTTVTATLPLEYAVYTSSAFIQELIDREIEKRSAGGIAAVASDYYLHKEHTNEYSEEVYDVRRPLGDPPYDNFNDPNYQWKITNVAGAASRHQVVSLGGSYAYTHVENIAVAYTSSGGVSITGTWSNSNADGTHSSGSIGGGELSVNPALRPTTAFPSGALVLDATYWSENFHAETLLPRTAGATAQTTVSGTRELPHEAEGSDTITVDITATAALEQREPWDYSLPTNPGDEGWRPPCGYEKYLLASSAGATVETSSHDAATAAQVPDATRRSARGNLYIGEGRDSDDAHRKVVLIAAGALTGATTVSGGYTGVVSGRSFTYESQWQASGSAPPTVIESTWTSDSSGTLESALDAGFGTVTGYAKLLIEALSSGGALVGGETTIVESATAYIYGSVTDSRVFVSDTVMASSSTSRWTTGMPASRFVSSGGSVMTSAAGSGGATQIYSGRSIVFIDGAGSSAVMIVESGGAVVPASSGASPVGSGVSVPSYTMADIDFTADGGSATDGAIINSRVYTSRSVHFSCAFTYNEEENEDENV